MATGTDFTGAFSETETSDGTKLREDTKEAKSIVIPDGAKSSDGAVCVETVATELAADSSANVFDEGCMRQVRILLAGSRSNEMAQDYVQVKIEDKRKKQWSNELWKSWVEDHHDFLSKYQYYDKQEKTEQDGVMVPVYKKIDITFFQYMMKKIVSDKTAFTKLSDFRNNLAHSTRTAATEEEFVEDFDKLFGIVESLFCKHRKYAIKWREELIKIKTETSPKGIESVFKKDIETIREQNRQSLLDIQKRIRNLELSDGRKKNFEIDMENFQKVFKDIVKKNIATFSIPGCPKKLEFTKVSIFQSLKDVTSVPENRVCAVPAYKGVVFNLFFENPNRVQKTRDKEAENPTRKSKSFQFSYPDLYDTVAKEIEFSASVLKDENELEYSGLHHDNIVSIIASYLKGQRKDQILISAAGGMGKTVCSQKIMLEWAENKCLKEFWAVIRIDMKCINFEESLFQNMVRQYPGIKSSISDEDINTLETDFNQKKVLWMIDGLDENKYRHKSEEFIKNSLTSHAKSLFIFLTRPEGKDVLEASQESFTEFTILPLNEEKFITLVGRFPFKGEKAKKMNKIIDKYRTNSEFRSCVSVPMNAVAYCALMDEEEAFSTKDKSFDILLSLVGMSLKSGELKSIETKLQDSALLENEKEKLKCQKTKVFRMSTTQILKSNNNLLCTLGRAVFITNGNCLAGFDDIKEELICSLVRQTPEIDVNQVLQLTLYEHILHEKASGTQSHFRFYHRNIRELILGIYLSQNSNILEAPSHKERISDSVVSVFRCCLTVLQQNSLKENIDFSIVPTLIGNIVQNCSDFDEWRFMNIVCELLKLAVIYESFLPSFEECFKLLQDTAFNLSSFPHFSDIPFIQQLRHHAAIAICGKCKPPKAYFASLDNRNPETNIEDLETWPDLKSFIVNPLLIYTDKKITLSFPSSSKSLSKDDESSQHLKKNSEVICVTRPPTIDSDVLSATDIPSPFVDFDKKSANWPGAIGHLVFILLLKIHLWSGVGKNGEFLPTKFVWIFDHLTLTWSRVETGGNVPPPLEGAAGVVIDEKLYVHGGRDESRSIRGELYSYEPSGKIWTLIKTKGFSPPERFSHFAWTNGRDLFIVGGQVLNKAIPKEIENKQEFLLQLSINSVTRFDLQNRCWLPIEVTTQGEIDLSELSTCFAKVKNKILSLNNLHVMKKSINFYSLNLNDFQWSTVTCPGEKKTLPLSSSLMIPISRHVTLLTGQIFNTKFPRNSFPGSHYVWFYDERQNILRKTRIELILNTKMSAVFLDGHVFFFGGSDQIIKIDVYKD